MAGAGYKLFVTGDVLTAAQVNTYLQQQTVMVFANSTARSTALSGVVAQGMVTFLTATNSLEYYDGSAWQAVSNPGDITSVTAGTGLSGGGTSGAVTLSLATPVAETNGGTNQTTYTTGDVLYASASNTLSKRAIGTSGQVLTVSGGLPTWATPATTSSGMTKVSAGTFSGSGNVIFDSFSTTYKRYKVLITMSGSASTDVWLRFRYGASNEFSSTSYYGALNGRIYDNTTWTATASGATKVLIGNVSSTASQICLVDMTFTIGSSDSVRPVLVGLVYRTTNAQMANFGYETNSARTDWNGFNFFPDTGTLTGSYGVYGLAD